MDVGLPPSTKYARGHELTPAPPGRVPSADDPEGKGDDGKKRLGIIREAVKGMGEDIKEEGGRFRKGKRQIPPL